MPMMSFIFFTGYQALFTFNVCAKIQYYLGAHHLISGGWAWKFFKKKKTSPVETKKKKKKLH